jgi:hypothetical protein
MVVAVVVVGYGVRGQREGVFGPCTDVYHMIYLRVDHLI